MVPDDGPAWLGMPDIKLLGILKIIHEVIGDPHESRKFNSQTIEASNNPSYRTNRVPQDRTDTVDVHDNNVNMPYYFKLGTNRATHKVSN